MMMGPGRGHMMLNEASKPTAVSATMARLWQYFRPYRLTLIVVGLMVVGSTYVQVLTPGLIGQAVDCYLTPATEKLFGAGASNALPGVPATVTTNCWFARMSPQATASDYVAGLGGLILLIVGLFVASSVMTGLQFFLMTYTGQRVLRNLRVAVFEHIHRLSLGYFSQHEAGDVMSRITNDADTIQQALTFPLVSMVQGSLLVVWIALTMLTTSPAYAAVSLVVAPFMFFTTSWLSARARRAFRQVRLAVGDVNASLEENFAAVREAQAFNREAENIQHFNLSNAASRDASIRAVAYTSALSPALEALGYVSMAIVAGVGGMLLLNGQHLLGTQMSTNPSRKSR